MNLCCCCCREYCFPYKIDWNPLGAGTEAEARDLGQYTVVASRDIRPLELVLFEWNLVIGPEAAILTAGEACAGSQQQQQNKQRKCSECFG